MDIHVLNFVDSVRSDCVCVCWGEREREQYLLKYFYALFCHSRSVSEKIKKGKCRKKKEEKISKLTIKPINLFVFFFFCLGRGQNTREARLLSCLLKEELEFKVRSLQD